MSLLTDAAAGILTPEDVGNLVLRPIQQTSVALQVCIVVRPTAHVFRIPVVDEDAAAEWVNEAEDIT